jgi:hypothetical protein
VSFHVKKEVTKMVAVFLVALNLTSMDLLQFADSIEGFAEVQEEVHIDTSHGELKAEIERLRQELRQLQSETKAQVKVYNDKSPRVSYLCNA